MIRSGIYTLGIIVLTGILVPAYAQPGTDTTWKRGGNIGINLSQVSLSQWAAGGDNAVGFNLQFNYFANYKKAKHLWNNRLELDYGLNKTKSDGTKKTNDKIYLSSTYGYEIAKNWYASGLMTFQTQFAKGYDYNVDPDVFISRFMSPGYLLIGAGFTWTPKSWFTATFTPATWRGTFVSSKILSDQGDFGVTPGKHLFSEFGANLRMEAKYEFLKNMTVFSRLNRVRLPCRGFPRHLRLSSPFAHSSDIDSANGAYVSHFMFCSKWRGAGQTPTSLAGNVM